MKKTNFVLVCLILKSLPFLAQNNKDFNRWSIELNTGVNNPSKTFTEGYFTNYTSDNVYDIGGINHYDLGIRFMFTELYGAKLDFGYDAFKNMSSSTSLPFSTKKYRVGGQGILNLRKLFGIDSFTNTFGLLLHAGGHLSMLNYENTSEKSIMISYYNLTNDKDYGVMIGLTPQIKITSHLVATLDYTYIRNFHQEVTWDGINYSREQDPEYGALKRSKFNSGDLHNFSLGLTYYIGSKESHADFYKYVAPPVVTTEPKKPADTDKDGIIDSKDECPDVKGLIAFNGCPDTDGDGITDKLDSCPEVKGVKENGGCPWPDSDADGVLDKDDKCPDLKGTIAKIGCPEISEEDLKKLNELIIKFQTDRSDLKDEYKNTLISIKEIIEKYPTTNFAIEGHTDSTGSESYNLKLSEERANALKDYLINNNINPSILTVIGYGESKPIDTNKTRAGRAKNRRVEVRVLDK